MRTRNDAASQKIYNLGAEAKRAGLLFFFGRHLLEAQRLWPLGRMMSLGLGRPARLVVYIWGGEAGGGASVRGFLGKSDPWFPSLHL